MTSTTIKVILSPKTAFKEISDAQLDVRTSLSLSLFVSFFFASFVSIMYSRALLAPYILHGMLFWMAFILLHCAVVHACSRSLGGKANFCKSLGCLSLTYVPLQIFALACLPFMLLFSADFVFGTVFFNESYHYLVGIAVFSLLIFWFSKLNAFCIREVYGLSRRRAEISILAFVLLVIVARLAFLLSININLFVF